MGRKEGTERKKGERAVVVGFFFFNGSYSPSYLMVYPCEHYAF